MLVFLVMAASLLTQAYIFRDTPAHPADPCVADAARCPEESLDSLLVAREKNLERMRKIARGENPDSVKVAGSEVKPAAALPDAAQAEACRLEE
jgi:hypothetical protein